MARPTTYTDEIGSAICQMMMDGMSLTKICEEEGMPARSSVYLWLMDHKTFSDGYARAREVRLQRMADDMDDIGQGTLDGKHDPQAAKVAIDTKKWLLSKLVPRTYGDKLAVGGDPDAPPIQTEAKVKLDLSDLSMEELDVLEKVMRRTGAKLPQEEEDDEPDV